MKNTDVIIRPLITEKCAYAQQTNNKYSFAVARLASKYDVKNAVNELFNVTVTCVRTMVMPGKYKRVGKTQGKASDWKKAIVTLKEGDRIEFLEGA